MSRPTSHPKQLDRMGKAQQEPTYCSRDSAVKLLKYVNNSWLGGGCTMPTSRLAVVLYGRIGSLDYKDGSSFRSRDSASASGPMMVMVFAAFSRHVLEPAARTGSEVDVFGHTWSPAVANVLEELWRPRSFAAEEPLTPDVLSAA